MLKKVIVLYLICFFFLPTSILEAWDNVRTHPDLCELASRKSILQTQDYLSNIGFKKGLDESLNGKEAFRWIRDGANLEDAGNLLQSAFSNGRFFNHFHNPLWEWENAGLDDWVSLPPFHVTGQSLLLWAQDGNNQENFPQGNWSWDKVREYFYISLTGKDFTGTIIATTKNRREEYFARTFRGLGHQMHLVQDAAVPYHVRNDSHPTDSKGFRRFGSLKFERWARDNYNYINSIAATALFPTVSFNVSYNGLVPITQLVDANEYNGTYPSTNLSQGLAEYTNANFASEDTIFTEDLPTSDRYYFPYPRKSSTDLQSYMDGQKLPESFVGKDNLPDTAFWIRKTTDGEVIDHFVRPTYVTNYVNTTGSLYSRTFYCDERSHEDYAAKLVPRAVGYSAQLLNYFFRGQIQAVGFAQTDAGEGYISGVTLNVKNNTPGEAIDVSKPGRFVVAYQYEDAGTTIYGASGEVPLAESIASGDTSSTNYYFSFPNSIPSGAQNLKYFLVYRGKLGNEDDSVVANMYTRDRLIVVGFINEGDDNGIAIWFDENLNQLKEITVPSRGMGYPPEYGPNSVAINANTKKAFNTDNYDYLHSYDMEKMDIIATVRWSSQEDWMSAYGINNVMVDDYIYFPADDYTYQYPNRKMKVYQYDTKNDELVLANSEFLQFDESDGGGVGQFIIRSNDKVFTDGGAPDMVEVFSPGLNYLSNLTLPGNSYVLFPSGAYDPVKNRGYVYQYNYPVGNIVAFDGTTGMILGASVGFGGNMEVGAAGENGQVLYAYMGPAQEGQKLFLYKFDSSMNILGQSSTFGTREGLSGIAMSTDKKFAYVCSYGGNPPVTGTDGFSITKIRVSDMSVISKKVVSGRHSLGIGLCDIGYGIPTGQNEVGTSVKSSKLPTANSSSMTRESASLNAAAAPAGLAATALHSPRRAKGLTIRRPSL